MEKEEKGERGISGIYICGLKQQRREKEKQSMEKKKRKKRRKKICISKRYIFNIKNVKYINYLKNKKKEKKTIEGWKYIYTTLEVFWHSLRFHA